MLLNLTNHPSNAWSTSQRKTAIAQYDRLEDLPFPKIDPNWSAEEVKHLAAIYEKKILEINPKAVLIMGEFTFTYQLLQRLKELDIPCIAATTERKVIEDK